MQYVSSMSPNILLLAAYEESHKSENILEMFFLYLFLYLSRPGGYLNQILCLYTGTLAKAAIF